MLPDPFLYEGSSYSQPTRPEQNMDLHFLSDPPLTFPETSIDDLFQELTDSSNQVEFEPPQNTVSALLSYSPPTSQLQCLSIHQGGHNNLMPLPFSPNLENELPELPCLDPFQVKAEDFQTGLEFFHNQNQNQSIFFPPPHSYSGDGNLSRFMQRSYSINSPFEECPGINFRTPNFDPVIGIESPCFNTQIISSPEENFLAGQMRKVFSTGDLQNVGQSYANQQCYSSPAATESLCKEDTNSNVVRYTAEERKERISRYRAKRSQRNYNKTIKYACRKTLADNRARRRGRFVRNEEVGEIQKSAFSNSTKDEEDDFFWLEGMLEEEQEANGTVSRNYGNSYEAASAAQFYFNGC